jgi:hypothetical protein
MLGIEGYKHYMELKSTCLKQCKNKGSLLDVKTIKAKLLHELGDIQMDILFTVSPESIIDTEYLIYDGLGMLGSIGGSLGLFLGFSLFDSLSMVLDAILVRLKFK